MTIESYAEYPLGLSLLPHINRGGDLKTEFVEHLVYVPDKFTLH